MNRWTQLESHTKATVPPPCSVFPSQKKIPVSFGDQLQYFVFTSVQQADSDSWFYFRPSAHLQKMDLGWLFFGSRVSMSPMSNVQKSIYKYFLWLLCRRGLCTSNQVTLVSSSRLPSMRCILLQLLLLVMICQNMHIQIHYKHSHYSVLLLIPKQWKCNVQQV